LLDCLRSARRSANVTQVELAKRLGTDQSFVSKYERGERRIDVLELRAICIALGFEFISFLSTFEEKLKREGL
jgi:transcriptional regulator with XRE-family HTH domain